jgi:DinB family
VGAKHEVGRVGAFPGFDQLFSLRPVLTPMTGIHASVAAINGHGRRKSVRCALFGDRTSPKVGHARPCLACWDLPRDGPQQRVGQLSPVDRLPGVDAGRLRSAADGLLSEHKSYSQSHSDHRLVLVDGLEGGWLGPRAWADPMPCATVPDLRREQAAVDAQLVAVCDALSDASLGDAVRLNRDTRVQTERRDQLLLHQFQHQIHHRGQVHAMLSGTRFKSPQLDEFYSTNEAPLRASEFAALGWTEETVWGQ